MKSTGIVRRVDLLGRIVLPRELRKTLSINTRDELEFYIDNEKIILLLHNTWAPKIKSGAL